MRPINEKSLFHYFGGILEKIDNNSIEDAQVKNACMVSKEMIKLLQNEQNRTRLFMEMDVHERNFGHRPAFRELAGKGFDDTTIDPRTGTPRNDDAQYLK